MMGENCGGVDVVVAEVVAGELMGLAWMGMRRS